MRRFHTTHSRAHVCHPAFLKIALPSHWRGKSGWTVIRMPASSAYQSKLNGSASAPSVAANTLLNSSKVIVPELSLNSKSVTGSYGGERSKVTIISRPGVEPLTLRRALVQCSTATRLWLSAGSRQWTVTGQPECSTRAGHGKHILV